MIRECQRTQHQPQFDVPANCKGYIGYSSTEVLFEERAMVYDLQTIHHQLNKCPYKIVTIG